MLLSKIFFKEKKCILIHISPFHRPLGKLVVRHLTAHHCGGANYSATAVLSLVPGHKLSLKGIFRLHEVEEG